MWPAIERRIVRRVHPGAYCAVSFGETSAEDRFRIFDPGARRYLGEWQKTPGSAWASAAVTISLKNVS